LARSRPPSSRRSSNETKRNEKKKKRGRFHPSSAATVTSRSAASAVRVVGARRRLPRHGSPTQTLPWRTPHDPDLRLTSRGHRSLYSRPPRPLSGGATKQKRDPWLGSCPKGTLSDLVMDIFGRDSAEATGFSRGCPRVTTRKNHYSLRQFREFLVVKSLSSSYAVVSYR
jgi:hypothetical protein